MITPAAQPDPRPGRPHTHRHPRRCLGLVTLVASCLATAAPSPATPPAPDLATVLDVTRLPDVDLLFLRDGHRQSGVLANEQLHLRTAHGTLTLPARSLAAIELSNGRRELDSVITVNRNRLSGFLEDIAFTLNAGETGPAKTIRREKLDRIVLRRRPGQAQQLPPGSWVLLRNGDFFTGTLLNDRFTAQDAGTELRWSTGAAVSATFPQDDEGPVQLLLTNGETLLALPPGDDLEFELSLGPRITIYRGRIDGILAPGPLPAGLLRRLGAADADEPAPGAGNRLPDPNVSPGEGMVWMPPGDFVMGSSSAETDRDLDEGPQTRVVFLEGFWIARHEVTQAEFEAVTGRNPSHHMGEPRRPAERISWYDAMSYCLKRTERERAARRLPPDYHFRLPTEAEWEYACRAGTSTRFSFGEDPDATAAAAYAWFSHNSESTTHPVGLLKPNPAGLFDMHGNVWEWCLDAWAGALPGGVVTNRPANPAGTLRVARGGSWLYDARFCRSANRDSYGVLNRFSDVGLRVVLARVATDAAAAPRP